MEKSSQPKTRRVLIASSHALFGQGLRSLLEERKETGVVVVGMVANLEEAIESLHSLDPDLIIVDYDDEQLNRDEFLARFVEGEKEQRVVLLSLQSGKEALVYDRRSLAASEIDEWLQDITISEESQDETPKMNQPKTIDGNRRRNMKHLVIAGILVVIVTVGLIIGLENINLLPVQASAQAVPIDNLFGIEFKICTSIEAFFTVSDQIVQYFRGIIHLLFDIRRNIWLNRPQQRPVGYILRRLGKAITTVPAGSDQQETGYDRCEITTKNSPPAKGEYPEGGRGLFSACFSLSSG